MKIQKAAEDYLEAMLMLKEKKGYIRSIDIAQLLGVTKPSVTYSTKRLRENGYITMDRDGMISLTSTGMEIATRIYTAIRFLPISSPRSAFQRTSPARMPARWSMT